jgi:hypothetical protein
MSALVLPFTVHRHTLRGRRYNRAKKANDGSRGNQYTEAADKMSTATAERLAVQHGVTERTGTGGHGCRSRSFERRGR